jgi:hypothetical protein
MKPSIYVRASEYTGIFVLAPENGLKTFTNNEAGRRSK